MPRRGLAAAALAAAPLAAAALAACLLATGCTDDETPTGPAGDSPPQVIVYGRDTCAYTSATRSALETAGIVFTYRSIDVAANATEMWEKVFATSWYTGGSVGLPVVDVDGAVLERPSLAEIQSLLASS
jgi:glutaredoxin